jgi:hypothetical protein
VDEDRNGVLLVRVWLEDGTGHFRARLTTPGPGGGLDHEDQLTVAVTSSPDGVSQAVCCWLGAFLRDR